MLKKLNITLYNLLMVIAVVAAIYYNGMHEDIAKFVSMGIFALLFVCALLRCRKEGILPLFKKWAFWLILYSFVNFLYGFEAGEVFPLETAMPLMIAFSSTYLFTLDYKQFKLWFMPIGLFLSYVAFMSVIQGLGSLMVNENSGGLELGKNQIGPCFISIAIVAYIYFINREAKIWERVILGIITIFNVYPALYMGCRTALFCFFAVAIVSTFVNYKAKGVIVLSALMVALILLFGRNDLVDVLYRSFVGQRDITDFSDMTSGRDANMMVSLDYFFSHPLTGFYGSGDGYNLMPPNAHMYLLFHLTKWGLIGAIPALAIYFSVCKLYYYSYKAKDMIVFALLSVALIESLAEYAPPFGPGSAYTITYLMLGMFLRDKGKEEMFILK